MSDFNGRIGAIERAARKGTTPSSFRYVIRETLRAEHADGWKEGHADGLDDAWQDIRAEREAAAAAERPAQYAWEGTNSRGEEHRGAWQMLPAHVAAVVEDRFETGWRSLAVTQDGEESVAGIRQHPGKPGELQWWADEAALRTQMEER